MDSADWKFAEAGVDYVTITGNDKASEYKVARWFSLYSQIKQGEGYEQHIRRNLGYTGHSVGSGFYGKRFDGFMLRVSGREANHVVEAIRGLVVNVTRIDLQLTARTIPGMPMWGAWVATAANSARSAEKGCNWAKIKHLNTFGQGDTVTIGSRQSEKYGRIYDKEMESLDPFYAGCWRYEVEYKGPHAAAALERLHASSDIQKAVAGLVVAQYQAWCVPVPRVQDVGGSTIQGKRPVTDLTRKLEWLRKQVMPTMVKVLELGGEKELDDIIKGVYDSYRGV